jgi:hypothetical protein
LEAKKGELDEQLMEYINDWRKQRSKEEEELKRLKEKQAKRKEVRAEQEKKLAQQKVRQKFKPRSCHVLKIPMRYHRELSTQDQNSIVRLIQTPCTSTLSFFFKKLIYNEFFKSAIIRSQLLFCLEVVVHSL